MGNQSAWVQLGNWLAGLLHIPADPWGAAIGLFIGGFVVLNLIMGVVTYMIWWLRKLVAFMQSRLGPMHVGWYGLMQTPADALKLMSKEGVIPTLADKALFTVAPALVFIAAYLVYATVPFTPTVYLADLNVGVVYVSAVSSITVIAIVLGAWSSNNKYALISAFRSAAQIVSYEVPFALAVIGPVALAGSFSFLELVAGPNGQAGGQLLRSIPGLGGAPQTLLDWFVFTQPIVALCFVVAGLAENNITPFDIVEAESEIVAGFHIEYSGMKFALFFLAEFANTMTLAVLTTLLFFGGWTSLVADDAVVRFLGGLPFVGAVLPTVWHLAWFGLKVGIGITIVFWLRATLPRVRVDQLMDLGWKFLIPVTLFNVVLTGAAVLLEWPRFVLALVNWAILAGVLLLGMRKPLPKADLSRGLSPGVAPRNEVTA
jgi:NADH-quinone oxidoreductase subunit H